MNFFQRRFDNSNHRMRYVPDMHQWPPLLAATQDEDFSFLNRVQGHQVDHQVEAHPGGEAEDRAVANGGPSEIIRL